MAQCSFLHLSENVRSATWCLAYIDMAFGYKYLQMIYDLIVNGFW